MGKWQIRRSLAARFVPEGFKLPDGVVRVGGRSSLACQVTLWRRGVQRGRCGLLAGHAGLCVSFYSNGRPRLVARWGRLR